MEAKKLSLLKELIDELIKENDSLTQKTNELEQKEQQKQQDLYESIENTKRIIFYSEQELNDYISKLDSNVEYDIYPFDDEFELVIKSKQS